MIRGKTVDEYISKAPEWAQVKLETVRRIALELGMTETVKWRAPVFVHKSNVVGLGAFKNWVSIWFFNGVFLSDEEHVLITAQDETKGLRQWRFLPEQTVPEDKMRQYILEAISNDEKGMVIKPKRNTNPAVVPEHLRGVLSSNQMLQKTFDDSTLSQQREYCEYINEAKREETKVRRVQKAIQLIGKNQGLNDKYK